MKDVNLVLADHTGFGRILLCEHGSIHFTVGPVTLNLEPAAFLQMAALIRNATERLSVIREASKSSEDLFQMLESSPSRMMH